jgi:hypothetical protein
MKQLVIIIIGVLASFGMIEARAEVPPREADQILAVITNLHLATVSSRYSSAAVNCMLGEANYFSKRLKLGSPYPIHVRDVEGHFVGAPMREDDTAKEVIAKLLRARIGTAGFIETTNFCFNFRGGRLFEVVNRINDDERFSMYDEWAKTRSVLDTNGAYQLAKGWLAAVDVDVGALEERYKPRVEQRWFWSQPGLNVNHPLGDTNKTMLPIYEVSRGTDNSNWPAQVQVLGTTKELMKLHLGDLSLSRRPLLLISNAIELNNIADAPLKAITNSAKPASLQAPSHR